MRSRRRTHRAIPDKEPSSALLPNASLPSPSTTRSSPILSPPVLRIPFHGREHYVWRGRVSLLPVDAAESARLDVLHRTIYIFALRYKLHLSDLLPAIRAGQFRVLNVAYSTALWATWMMELYPTQIHIVGIDIERVHPAWLQCRHENLELLFPVDYNDRVWGGLTPASFDYLHMDNPSASVADWSALLRTALRYRKPCTGRIELVLLDWTPRSYKDSPTDFPRATRRMRDWYDDLKTATTHLGFLIAYRQDIGALLHSAGFVDVCEEIVRIPLCKDTGSKHDEEIAMCFRGGMSDPAGQAYQGMAMQPFTQVLGYTPERVFEACELVARIPYYGEVRLYHDLHIWTARKPAL
ncbi:hypothetical protein LTR02_000364 [Friedmanniomyces endolithicus]|nr:hypothetical protein LTR94_010455 [Friedmanniomyces endolithicus]KAK0792558.1 hypothetical protein LTR75_011438 [Friedmanniomyces endolithicus]KAK0793972.1 hypothetical protein LTR38_009381 [Friedmanniomyces endolithicus]KAK0806256.1 hypothetical protein LTR59_003669 [Friedmanniomyces endolithicus]KAK0841953.1 hypothetical protein LTR03_009585 [Friedmanniomyces endolithicus]